MYNHRAFVFVRANDARSLQLQNSDGSPLLVDLIGVKSVSPSWDSAARRFCDLGMTGQPLTLLFPSTQTRDRDGNLTATVYDGKGNSINAQVIEHGFGLVDRSMPFPLQALLFQAQAQARRDKLGCWAPSPAPTDQRIRH